MFNQHDLTRNECMLTGLLRRKGYDWWWHSFTGVDRKTGEERAFFIEFFLCNPALAGKAPVFGQLPENRAQGRRPSYLMVKAGCWGEQHKQLHRFFAWKDVKVHDKAPFSVEADDCYASETKLKGSVSVSPEEAKNHPEYLCDGGSISWNLTVDKKVAFNVGYGAGRLFRTIQAFEMYWHAEGMKTAYEGTVIVDGREYLVKPESCYGYADKNWGRNFTSPWVWLSSNCLISNLSGKVLKNSVFDIGGGRPKIYFIPLDRKLLGAFWYEGEEYEFNFSKFWTGTKTKFSCTETKDEIIWRIHQENHQAVMKTRIRCNKKEMLLVNYESPDGCKRHNRLWNGGTGTGRILLYRKTEFGRALVDDISVSHVGCEYGEY